MKKFAICMMLASAAGAVAQDATPTWTYALPETGLLPSAFSYNVLSSMRERHSGASHFSMQNVSLTIPFADPYKSSVHGWAFNAEFSSTLSYVNADGALSLESDTLYRFSLPLSLIRKTENNSRVILSLAPTVASDLECGYRSFGLGFFGVYTRPVNERFSFTAGVAAYPRFARHYAVPFLGFEWKPTDDWTVALKGYRLSAMHAENKRFCWGPFLASEGGVWAVQTARGARLLSVQSLVAGVAGEYDFSAAGQRKRIITASVGSTLATSVRFHEYRGDREADEAHHYRPGLYASFGVDFRF